MSLNRIQIVLIIIATIFIIFLLFRFFPLIEKYGIAIQALSTIILAIITTFYAVYTAQISKQTEKQIVSDIKVNIVKRGGKGFSKDVTLIEKDDDYTMDLTLEVYNKNSASGSITVPELIFALKDKEILRLKGNIVSDINNGVIFVRGGEIKRTDISYKYYFGQNPDWEIY
mgnify:CR=1 FL=1